MSSACEAIINAPATVSHAHEPTHVLFINQATADSLTAVWYDAQQAVVSPSPWHEGGLVEHDGDVCEVSISAWVNDGKVYKWARTMKMTTMVVF